MTINTNKIEIKFLESSPKQVEYDKIYTRMYLNHFSRQLNNLTQLTKDQTTKAIYWGVRGVPLMFNSLLNKDLSKNDKNKTLNGLISAVLLVEELIGTLTPNELITIFPIEKRYNSNKYEVNDYYTTIGALKKIGMDTAIGDNVTMLMCEYLNEYLCIFTMTKICILSALRRIQNNNNSSIIYELMTSPNGKEFLYDTHNYITYITKNRKPSSRRLPVV